MSLVMSRWKFWLIGLLENFDSCHKELGVQPQIPNRRLEQLASTDHGCDKLQIGSPAQPYYMSSNLLLSMELILHNQSIKCVDEELAVMDDKHPNSYTGIENEATNTDEMLDDKFRCS